MNRQRLGAAAIMLAMSGLAAVPALAQSVYRYKDAQGQWVYTDRPPASRRPPEALTLSTAVASPRILVEPRSGPNGIALVAVNECRCAVEFGVKTRSSDGSEHAGRAVVAPRSEQVLIEVPAPPGPANVTGSDSLRSPALRNTTKCRCGPLE